MKTENNITFSVNFLMDHMPVRGLAVLESATKKDPVLLKDILRAGWGESVCTRDISVGKRFLKQLTEMDSPEDAKQALSLYFKNTSRERINSQLFDTLLMDEIDNKSNVIDSWLNKAFTTRFSGEKGPTTSPVAKELIKQAKNLGADFDKIFKDSIYNHSTSALQKGDHTLLSSLLHDENTNAIRKNDYGNKIAQVHIDRALFLLELGKSFDETSANRLIGMTPESGIAWCSIFIEKKATTATEILRMTSGNEFFNPDTRAILSSMSAMESINEMMTKNKSYSLSC